MTDNFSNSGNEIFIKRFLKTLRDGNSLITKAYNGKLNDSNIDNFDSFYELINLQIIIKGSNGYHLNPFLNKILNSTLSIENGNFIDVNLKSRIPFIKRIAQNYINHLKRSETNLAIKAREELENIILEVVFEANGAIKSLSNRLQTQFGFVHTLEDKISENEAAIKLANELVENLTSYNAHDFINLIEQLSDNISLYQLIYVDLLGELAKSQSKLNSILTQLCEQLSKFRKQYRKTSRLKSFAQLYYRYKGYQPDNFIFTENIPSLFLKAEPLKLSVHPDVNNEKQTDFLTNTTQNLKKSDELLPGNTLRKSEFFKAKNAIYFEDVIEDPLMAQITLFLSEVLKSKDELSAQQYYENLTTQFKEDFSLNIFLIALNTFFFEEMQLNERELFEEPKIIGKKIYPNLNLGNTILIDMHFKPKQL